MHKIILALFLIFFTCYAGLNNAIAILVNDEPITLYDIDKHMLENRLSKDEAISELITKILYEQELKKYNIEVSLDDVNEQVAKIANSNNLSLSKFKSLVTQRNGSYFKYLQNIKNSMQRQRLITNVLANNLDIPNNNELKTYYKNNIDLFSKASSFSIIRYESRNKDLLLEAKKSILASLKGVSATQEDIEASSLSKELLSFFNSIKIGTFSQILPNKNIFIMVYMKDKKNLEFEKFEDVKTRVFNILMENKRKNYLEDFFNTVRQNANIKILR